MFFRRYEQLLIPSQRFGRSKWFPAAVSRLCACGSQFIENFAPDGIGGRALDTCGFAGVRGENQPCA
jgi:hypothetical protein